MAYFVRSKESIGGVNRPTKLHLRSSYVLFMLIIMESESRTVYLVLLFIGRRLTESVWHVFDDRVFDCASRRPSPGINSRTVVYLRASGCTAPIL